jgi:hypothetical protein
VISQLNKDRDSDKKRDQLLNKNNYNYEILQAKISSIDFILPQPTLINQINKFVKILIH